MSRPKISGGALILALLIGGCSAPSSAGSAGGLRGVAPADPSRASAAQAAEIADGKATAGEYHAAFRRYRECLRAAGFELENVELTGDVYEFGVPAAAVEESDADAECYDREYYFTDVLWQSSEEGARAAETTPELRRCLRERGIAPKDTRADIEAQVRAAGIEFGECFR